jgi:hypothetical protein
MSDQSSDLKPSEKVVVSIAKTWDNSKRSFATNAFLTSELIRAYGIQLLAKVAEKHPEMAAKLKAFQVE